MSLSPLAALRSLGIQASNLQITAAETGLRGLYSTVPRQPGSSILSVPFRTLITPDNFTTNYATGGQKLAWDAAKRAGNRLYTEQPKKAMVTLSAHDQASTLILATAQTELAAKKELVSRQIISPQQFLSELTPLQRWVTWLPTEREPQPLPRRLKDGCTDLNSSEAHLKQRLVDAWKIQLNGGKRTGGADNQHRATKVFFNEDEDDYFFCFHSGTDALCANLVDAIGQGNLSAVTSAIYEEGGGDEFLQPVTKWALHQVRSRTLWVPAPPPSRKTRVMRSQTDPLPSSKDYRRKVASCHSPKLVPIIAPGIDFVNHCTGLGKNDQPNARVRMDPITQAAVLEVLPSLGRPLRAGEEILLRYHTPQCTGILQSYELAVEESSCSPNIEEDDYLGSATVNHRLPLKAKWQWQLNYGFVPNNVPV